MIKVLRRFLSALQNRKAGGAAYFRRLELLGLEDRITPSNSPIIVTTTAASGTGSLDAAITQANTTPGDDQISFNLTGTSPYTITLAGALPIIIGGSAGTLTINGLGASSLNISGSDPTNPNNATRNFNIFNIASGGNLSISGVTVSGARYTSGSGGAFNNQGTLAVSNSTLSGNSAGTFGGAIFNNNGALTLTNSTLSGNNATYGGGILNQFGTITISNSTLSGNSATTSGSGGGIHNNGSLTITNSTISGNSAARHGGGIFNNSNLTLTNSTLSGNSASSRGGGIYNSGNNLTVTNSTLSGNSAGTFGGGINNNGNNLTITNSTISGNNSNSNGGGISNYRGTLTLSNSTVASNSAANGGGIFNNMIINPNPTPPTIAILNITNSTIAGNSATTSGGGINNIGTLNIANTIIANSTSGGDYAGNGTVTLIPSGNSNNPTILANNIVTQASSSATSAWAQSVTSAQLNLGPLQNNGGPTFTMALLPGSVAIAAGNSTISNASPVSGKDQRGINRITSDIGAYSFGIQVTTTAASGTGSLDAAITLANNTPGNDDINFNLTGTSPYTITLAAALPTILNVSTAGTLTITGLGASSLNISGSDPTNLNNATRNFNIFNIASGGNLSISGVTVSGSKTSGSGGAFNNAGILTVTNSTLSGNTAGNRGGGIWNSGTLSVTNSTISGNSAIFGGGIYNSGGILTVTNSTISGNFTNSSFGGGGGGIANSGSGTLTVTNSTLSGNTAYRGGGINNYGSLTVTNSTLSGNAVFISAGLSSGNRGGGINNSGTLTVTNSTFSGNFAYRLGGGINNSGSLTVTNSTLSGNTSNSTGGGINNSGTLNVTNSTLSGNTADSSGGGIYNSSSLTVTVTNSTLSGNTAFNGGGIRNSGTLTVTNSTLSGNFTSSSFGGTGGGINNSGTLAVTNTIIANSIRGGDFAGNAPTLNLNNLVPDGSLSGASIGAPLLGPLQNNGGPTFTMALGFGSAAIGTTPLTPSNLDQRGFKRTNNDIGSTAYLAPAAINDIVISVNPSGQVGLFLSSAGTAITDLHTAFAGNILTITATTAGNITGSGTGITIDNTAKTITVDLTLLSAFSGIFIEGNSGNDLVTIGAGGVDLSIVTGGGVDQSLIITTGAGNDTLNINNAIKTKGTGAVLITNGGTGTDQINLGATVITTGGNITFSNAVTLSAGAALSSGSGSITFGSTLDGAQTLGLTAGAGTVTFTGAVGNSNQLSALTITSAGDVSIGAAMKVTGAIGITSNSGVNVFLGAAGAGLSLDNAELARITSGAALNITAAGAGTMTVNAVSGGGTISGITTLNAGGTGVTFATTASSFNNALTVASAATIAGVNITTSADAVIFSDAVTLTTAAVTIDTTNAAITFGGALDGAQTLGLTAGTGTVTFTGTVGNSTQLSALTITSAGDVSIGAAMKVTGAIGITSDSGVDVFLGTAGAGLSLTDAELDLITAAGSLNITAAGAGTMTVNAVSGGGTISGITTLNAGGTGVTFSGGASNFNNALTVASAATISDDITTTGAVSFTGAVTLDLGKTINAGSSSITIDGNDGAITLTGDLTTTNSTSAAIVIKNATTVSLGNITTGATGTVTLGATTSGDELTGAVTQTGIINTETLKGNTSSSVILAGANTITNLGAFTSTGSGGFSLNDAGGLSITGTVTNTSGAVTITTTVSVLSIGADITATGQSLILTGVGINQTTGTILAAGLTVNAGAGSIALNQSNNNFTGSVSLNNSGANNVAITDVNAIDFAASALGSGTLTVNAEGITQIGGAITQSNGVGAATFNAGAGVITLTNSSNNFTGTVSLNSTGATVAITDTNALTLGSPTLGTNTGVTAIAGTTLTLPASAFNTGTGDIDFQSLFGTLATNGTLTTSSGTVSLKGSAGVTVGHNITTTSGSVSVIGAGINLTTGNTIDAGSSTITIDGNDGAITLTGALTTTNTSATAIVIKNASTVSLGNITTGGGLGTVTLGGATTDNLTGAVTQTGVINTETLIGNTSAAVTLLGANTLTNLGAFTSGTGGFSLNDLGGLTVTGTVSNISGTVSIVTTVSPLTISGDITATGQSLTLTGVGIDQTTGTILAAGLTVNAGAGAIALSRTSNNFTGSVSLNNSGPNNVAITDANAIDFGTSVLGTGSLTVNAVGITQTGAITVAGTSSFNAGTGVITLTQSNNFTGSVTLNSTGASVAITDTNAIDFGASTLGSGTFTVNAVGITQSGVITVVGAASFNAGNGVITLINPSNNFTGAVSLNNSGANNVAIVDIDDITIGVTSLGSGTFAVTGSNIKLNSNVTTTNNIQTYTGNVVVNGDNGSGGLVLSSGSGAINITGNIDSKSSNNYSLTLTSTGDVTIGGTIGGTQALFALNITGNDISLGNIGGANVGTMAKVSVQASDGADNASITLTGTTYNTTEQQFYNSSAAASSFDGTHPITLTGGNSGSTINMTTEGASSNDNVEFTGLLDLNGHNLSIDTTKNNFTTGGDITFNQTVNGVGTLTLNAGSTGIITASGTIGATTPLTGVTITNAASGSFTGSIHADNLTITDTTDGGFVRFFGNLTVNTGMTVSPNGAYNVEILELSNVAGETTFGNSGLLTLGNVGSDVFNFTGGIIATNPSAINLKGTITAAGMGIITLGDSGTAITIKNGNGFVGGTSTGIITLGNAILEDGVTLTVGTGIANTINLAAVTGFASPGSSNLTINTTGAVTVAGAIGTDIGNLTITNSGGTTFQSTVAAATATITNTTGIVEFQGNLTLGTGLVTRAQGYGVSITGASSNIAGATTFANTGTVTLGNGDSDSTTFAGGLVITAPSSIAIQGTVATTNTTMTLGGVALNGSTTLNAGTGNINLNGVVSGAFELTPTTSAPGITTISGANSNTTTNVTSGVVQISNTQSTDYVVSGGTLKGTGTIGNLTATGSGIIAPGNSPGKVTTTNLSLSSTNTLQIEIQGASSTPVAGTDYDQIVVGSTGTVNLGGATLNLSSTFTGNQGTVFTIIDNQGNSSISTTFNGLAEGAFIQANGRAYQISYIGGTGSNDVTLTVYDPATVTSFTPTIGKSGTSVVITGTNFVNVSQVSFNGTVQPTYTENSPTQITTTIPSGATTGTISITTIAGTATSSSSITIDNTAPTLNISASPGSLKANETSTITFTFSEVVTGFSSSIITVTNGTITNPVASSSTVYTATFTPTLGIKADGTISVSNNYFDSVGNQGTAATLTPPIAINTVQTPLVTGSASTSQSGSSVVSLIDPDTGEVIGSAAPFPGFTGQIRVVSGDFNGDGKVDIIASAGPGGGPAVAVLDSQTGEVIESFFAFDPAFTGGVFVAVRDFNGDGILDIIAGAGAGGGPEVRIFDGNGLTVIRSFFAYAQDFLGGVSVASVDFNSDGILDLVTGAGPGGAPHVKVFDGATNSIISQWYAYPVSFTGGVYVAAGDIGNDGNIEVITGAGSGGAPVVAVWDPYTGALLAQFMAYAEDFTGGVRVGVSDGNFDGILDLVTGAGPGGGPEVKGFSFPTLDLLFSFFSGDPANPDGVFVS
jgi:hypothetical protein